MDVWTFMNVSYTNLYNLICYETLFFYFFMIEIEGV